MESHASSRSEEGSQFYVNVQPVIPFSLNDDWNVISRTIVPIVHQEDVFPGAGEQTGLGDTTQSKASSSRPAAETAEWSVPINAQVSKLVHLGKQPVSLFAGVRYWADSPEGVGPTGWGARWGVTFLFPKS